MILNNLKEISFCDTSTTTIESDVITTYEGLSGKKLYPGDPVRLFLQSLAQIIIQQRIIIDHSAKQNLLAYASGDMLEHIGARVGVSRLASEASKCTLRFTTSAPQQGYISIPLGTRVKAGELYFTTINETEITPGQQTIDVIVECTEKGAYSNGLLPGQITELVDVFPFFQSVVNITETKGGTDIEQDDALRLRIFEAPKSFSTAGSDEAYAFWAKAVSPEISDVAVISPNPGEVNIIPIGINGKLLSEELTQKVLKQCSNKNVRPLTDKVSVIQPSIVSYDIQIEYFISRDNSSLSSTIQAKVNKAIEDYIAWQQQKLGRDINPSELMYRVMQAGAKRVNITSPTFNKLDSTQIAKVKEKNIVFGGIENE